MRLQETSIDEFQIGFKCAHWLSFALWSRSERKDCGNEDTNEAQSYRKLIEWVTRNES
jgi:hypothetical protein